MFSRALNQDSWSISQEKVLARYANFLLCGLNFFDWILFFSLFLSVKEISLLVVWCHFAKKQLHISSCLIFVAHESSLGNVGTLYAQQINH